MADITATRFKELKARLDAELTRRKYKYAVNALKSPYSTEPAEGKKVEVEHYMKINDPISFINTSYGQLVVKNGSTIPNLDVLDAKLTILVVTTVQEHVEDLVLVDVKVVLVIVKQVVQDVEQVVQVVEVLVVVDAVHLVQVLVMDALDVLHALVAQEAVEIVVEDVAQVVVDVLTLLVVMDVLDVLL